MKKYFWTFIFLVVLAIFTLLLWRHSVQPPVKTGQPQAAVQTTNATAAKMSFTNQSAPNIARLTVPTNQTQASVSNSYLAISHEFVQSKNKPIDFYGQVIDQDSNPIAGADIKVGLETLTVALSAEGFVGAKYTHLEYTSGSDGRFEINGVSGDGGGITVAPKDGYILSPKAPPGFGGGTSGSYENPVIFKMWKKGPEAQLIGGNHIFGIDSGKVYTLDLITGKKIEGEADGDLLVTITRPPNAKSRDKFPWSFSIQAIQGGFAEPDPNDEFMYIAPASGYQPIIEMQFDTNNPNWVGVVNKNFFFCSRNGQVYGKAEVEVDSIYNVHSAIQISYTLNPDGSRNLQP